MRVSEIQCGRVTAVEVKPLGNSDFGQAIPVREEASIQFSLAVGSALLRIGDHACPVTGADRRHEDSLKELGQRNLPRLVWVAQALPNKGPTTTVLLRVHEFPSEVSWPDRMEIGVDEKVVEEVRKRRNRLLSVDDMVAWLSEEVIIGDPTGSDPVCVLLTGGPGPGRNHAFRLVGHGIAVDVARNKQDQMRVTRVVEARRAERDDERRPVVLARVCLGFCDATIAGAFRGAASSQLDELVKRAGSYLQVWQEYNKLERDSILKRARRLGWARYSSVQNLSDAKWRFRLAEDDVTRDFVRAFCDVGDTDVEVAEQPPDELQKGDGAASADASPERGKPRHRLFGGTVIGVSPGQREMDIRPPFEEDESKPPAEGVIFMALSGDRKRLERRERAQALIASAECPMPQLGLLIEGVPVPERRSKSHSPLSAAVRDVFRGNPTSRQVEALGIALNTPDIALIQGPPGTGKTAVIAALQARLAEIADAGEEVSGHTLLTSYQHDAVENAAAQTVVFGLPAIRVGGRRGASAEDGTVDRWRRDQAETVRADLALRPEPPVSEVLRRVRDRVTTYLRLPRGLEEATEVLDFVVEQAVSQLPTDLGDRLLELRQQIRRGPAGTEDLDADGRELAITAMRALRTDQAAFGDDGPQNARRVLRRLEPMGVLDAAERDLLAQAADWDTAASAPFLGELKKLQENLLDRLRRDQRPAGAPAVRADVEALLADVVDALQRGVRDSAAGVDAVLYEYLNDLENDAGAVENTVRKYTAVLAATCQQCVGSDMNRIKDDRTIFTNVVVDEAARANPLDLLIPMSRAERRIVLVGDHRQLPHILEPDVEAQLQKSVSEETHAALRRSLFERLFHGLRAREAADGIKRTVTLDVQYRMHPVLGEFVSDTFYKPYGESFRSGRPAGDFAHDLTGYEGRVGAWVDIPRGKGRECGRHSKCRPAEAQWIAAEVRRLGGLCPDLSFGVISFYSAQTDELLKAMEREALAERLDAGEFRIAASWRETRGRDGRLKERLRVGTVDAFQGKEFDVVILSMTRSNDLPAGDERMLRRKYGHLMLENRLCVAMSRQQRLLIVAGDAAMLGGEAAALVIRGLVVFRMFCEGPHGICLSA